MTPFTPERALMYLRKTPVLLRVILNGVDQARATANRDGENGWNVLEIVCHLNDYEAIFLERLKAMLEQEMPQFVVYDPDTLVVEHQYNAQAFDQVVLSLLARRASHVKLLEGLSAEQWQRKGIHPSWGEITVLEATLNTASHDVNHLEQIARVLRLEGAVG